MLLVLKCGLQKPAGVFTIPQLRSYKPSGTELPTEQLIRDDIWRAATDMRSAALHWHDKPYLTRSQSNKTDAFISAYAVNPREKSIPVAQTAECWQHQGHGFDSQGMYELIKCTPLMQYKSLGIKVANKCMNETKSCLCTNTHKNSAVDFHRNHCTDWNPCFWLSSQFSV